MKKHVCTDTDVKVVGVCTVLTEVLGKDWTKSGWDAGCKAVQQWCRDNDAHYYARPKEDYLEAEAIREAQDLGKTTVVCEDLS